MPEISRFYGIVIKMYFNDDEKHHTPHFHAQYGDDEASIDFDGNVIVGHFPSKQLKYVTVWADIHRDELLLLWNTMQNSAKHFKIKGLE